MALNLETRHERIGKNGISGETNGHEFVLSVTHVKLFFSIFRYVFLFG